jgi:hypothetical protein
MPPHAMGRCTSGACGLAGCDNGWADADGMSANGCECALDANAVTCGMATDVGMLAVGANRMLSGNLLPAGSSDWFQVTFATGGHPHVRLATNPGMNHRIDVQTSCLSSDLLMCPDTMGPSSGITEWEFSDMAGSGMARNTPWPGHVYVRVSTTAMTRVCMNYLLVVSN